MLRNMLYCKHICLLILIVCLPLDNICFVTRAHLVPSSRPGTSGVLNKVAVECTRSVLRGNPPERLRDPLRAASP